MAIKKRIKVNPLKIADKRIYEKIVSTCPLCGENVLEHRGSFVLSDAQNDNDWLYKATKRKVIFKCPKCGCQWQTKPFKE